MVSGTVQALERGQYAHKVNMYLIQKKVLFFTPIIHLTKNKFMATMSMRALYLDFVIHGSGPRAEPICPHNGHVLI